MFEPHSILLAEDSAQDAELILEALAESQLSHWVTRVKDGVEALAYLRSEGQYAQRRSGHPAVVLLDIKMPRMDGLEVLRSMRSSPELKLIPVVMLTSSREKQDLIRSYELGSNAYLVKPVKFSEFVMAVQQLAVFWTKLNALPLESSIKP